MSKPTAILDCCLIADASDRRAQFLQSAISKIGGSLAVISHQQAFATADALPLARRYKLETPAASEADFHWLSEIGAAAKLAPRAHGELVDLSHYHRGLAIYAERLQCLPRRWLVTPNDAVLMGDKWRCQQHLGQQHLQVPPLLGEVTSFDALRAMMRQQACHRVMLKTRYGSSASGVLAIRTDRQASRWQMIGSVEASNARLYNSLQLRRYHQLDDIINIVNQLTKQPCYAEQWLSKPKIRQQHFDLRAVCFAGQARQCVLRCTDQVLSNLHLGNQRADANTLSAPVIMQLQACAAQLQMAFPDSVSIAFDAIPLANGIRVIECNAFGDLLPGVCTAGLESYDDQARWCVNARH